MPLRTPNQTSTTGMEVVASPITMIIDWEQLTKQVSHYIWSAYCVMSGNYVAIITVLVVLILSFLLPDISQKLYANSELKSMKKVLEKMSNEVKQAEVSCLTVADEICSLHCNMLDDTTETSKEKVQDLSVCTSYCMRTTQSEPVHIEKKDGFFRRFFLPNRTSHKEITIMSYVYTDSFDAKKNISEQYRTEQ